MPRGHTIQHLSTRSSTHTNPTTTKAVGFFRTLVGAAEKWCLAKPDLIRAERSAHGGVSSSSSSASVGMGRQAAAVVAAAAAAAGKGVVRAGDRVVLQSQGANRAVLCVREVPGGGLEVGLVAPEAALLSHATWEVCGCILSVYCLCKRLVATQTDGLRHRASQPSQNTHKHRSDGPAPRPTPPGTSPAPTSPAPSSPTPPATTLRWHTSPRRWASFRCRRRSACWWRTCSGP